jgi:hypothetical protein
MTPPTVYSTEYFIFDYDTYDMDSQVMAYNEEESQWETVDLVDVGDSGVYSKFFFLNELPVAEPKSPVQKAKRKVDEMIEWVNKWSVKSEAVDEVLANYKEEIFQYLDEVAS